MNGDSNHTSDVSGIGDDTAPSCDNITASRMAAAIASAGGYDQWRKDFQLRHLRKPEVMSPMDESTWFNLPKYTHTGVVGNDGTGTPPASLLLQANPMRVSICFSAWVVTRTFQDDWVLSLSTSSELNTDSMVTGFLLTNPLPRIELFADKYPGLVQGPWYGIGFRSNQAICIHITEIIIKAWPTGQTCDK